MFHCHRMRRTARASLSVFVLLATFCAWTGVAGAAPESAPRKDPPASRAFHWPAGKRAAVSFTFDDARLSQIDTGLAILDQYGVKATFYVNPGSVEKRLEGWKRAVVAGHEIGNHTLTHPCSGNYAWSRGNALEGYSLAMMATQLDRANAQIERLLGVKPVTFAYPCGQKFVGMGRDTQSYVPLVAERFLTGRGWNDTALNDPAFVDLAQTVGTVMDDTDFEQMKKVLERAANEGRWVIFVGHEIGPRGLLVTDAAALAALCKYALDPRNGLWVERVDHVANYILQQRSGAQRP